MPPGPCATWLGQGEAEVDRIATRVLEKNRGLYRLDRHRPLALILTIDRKERSPCLLTQPQRPMHRLVSAAMVLTLVGVCLAPLALARVSLNTIDPVAIVTDNGRHIVVTGPISCTESEPAYLRVTVTQRSTGAVAEGSTRIACTVDTQQWEVHALIQGRETFQEGPATAVALGTTTDPRGGTGDAQQWLVNITLVAE